MPFRRQRELSLGNAAWPLFAAPLLPLGQDTGCSRMDASTALRLERTDLDSVVARSPRACETLLGLAEGCRMEVHEGPAYKLAVDVAVMAQDTQCIFGGRELTLTDWDEDHERKLEQVLDGLREGPRAEPLGQVLARHPFWSDAETVLEAIVYDLEREPIVEERSVETALRRALELAGELGAKSLAIDALGTEYRQLTAARFLEILASAYHSNRGRLTRVQRLVLATRDEQRHQELRAALQAQFAEARSGPRPSRGF